MIARSRVRGGIVRTALAVALVVALAVSAAACGKTASGPSEYDLQGDWVGPRNEFLVNGHDVNSVGPATFQDDEEHDATPWVHGTLKVPDGPGFTVTWDSGVVLEGRIVDDDTVVVSAKGGTDSGTFRRVSGSTGDKYAWEARMRAKLAGTWKSTAPKASEMSAIEHPEYVVTIELDKAGNALISDEDDPQPVTARYFAIAPSMKGPNGARVRQAAMLIGGSQGPQWYLLLLGDDRMVVGRPSGPEDYLTVLVRR